MFWLSDLHDQGTFSGPWRRACKGAHPPPLAGFRGSTSPTSSHSACTSLLAGMAEGLVVSALG